MTPDLQSPEDGKKGARIAVVDLRSLPTVFSGEIEFHFTNDGQWIVKTRDSWRNRGKRGDR